MITEAPATYTIIIPRWHPTRLNQLLTCHWVTAHRRKAADKAMVALYCRHTPPARGKRRVRLHILLAKGQRAADPDAYFKSLGDALVAAGMLVNDNRQHVEWLPVTFGRETEWGSHITFEDLY